jgi:hypothetical protein
MLRGLAAAALLGLGTLALAAAGLAFALPWWIARRWRKRLHATQR